MTLKPLLLAASVAFAGIGPQAQAHVTLETQQAAVGHYYKAVLRVSHGCDGSDTTQLRVRIPEGVLAVKPQPKPGWTLDIKSGAYDHPQTLHGAQLDKGVRELSWKGDLPDAYYDEFVFVAYLAPSLNTDKPLYFPVVQECKKGVTRWIDTSGHSDADNPAPHLNLQSGHSSAAHAASQGTAEPSPGHDG